jgi:hypothetical protein
LSRNLHIVFSEPPEGIADEEFNRWYDAHLYEILTVPGFVAASRFQLEPVVSEGDIPHRFLTVYEIDGDPADAIAALTDHGFGNKDTYVALKDVDSGMLELPEWFTRAQFASWNCRPLGDRVEAS